jgi:hypothetical protein
MALTSLGDRTPKRKAVRAETGDDAEQPEDAQLRAPGVKHPESTNDVRDVWVETGSSCAKAAF